MILFVWVALLLSCSDVTVEKDAGNVKGPDLGKTDCIGDAQFGDSNLIEGEYSYGVMTVVSLNLLHGFPLFSNLDQRTQMVADMILSLRPDFVAIQEVGQTPSIANRAQVLAEMTGYEWTWAKASGYAFAFEEGPGVLSRWPIIKTYELELPHKGLMGLEIRKVSGVKVQTSHGEAAMFSAHLTTQFEEEVKADQALAAYQLAKESTEHIPGFLAGDMNAEPESLAMRFLRGEAIYQEIEANLQDAWQEANPEDPGFTYSAKNPSRRIDYIYVIPWSGGKSRVLECSG